MAAVAIGWSQAHKIVNTVIVCGKDLYLCGERQIGGKIEWKWRKFREAPLQGGNWPFSRLLVYSRTEEAILRCWCEFMWLGLHAQLHFEVTFLELRCRWFSLRSPTLKRVHCINFNSFKCRIRKYCSYAAKQLTRIRVNKNWTRLSMCLYLRWCTVKVGETFFKKFIDRGFGKL